MSNLTIMSTHFLNSVVNPLIRNNLDLDISLTDDEDENAINPCASMCKYVDAGRLR